VADCAQSATIWPELLAESERDFFSKYIDAKSPSNQTARDPTGDTEADMAERQGERRVS
jgi:hypothetical protein